MNGLGLDIEKYSAEDFDCETKKLECLPALSYFTFCNSVLYILVGVSRSSLLIESTDSMIKLLCNNVAILLVAIIIPHHFFLFFIIIDGSISLDIVARMQNGNFTYINGETNATVWPGISTNIIKYYK